MYSEKATLELPAATINLEILCFDRYNRKLMLLASTEQCLLVPYGEDDTFKVILPSLGCCIAQVHVLNITFEIYTTIILHLKTLPE